MRQSLCYWIRMNTVWFLWIGIWNLYYVQKETLFQVFSYKFCEFLHNDGSWDFMRIILQIFGWLLLHFLLLNVIKIMATWKSRHQHLGIGICIGISIDISISIGTAKILFLSYDFFFFFESQNIYVQYALIFFLVLRYICRSTAFKLRISFFLYCLFL